MMHRWLVYDSFLSPHSCTWLVIVHHQPYVSCLGLGVFRRHIRSISSDPFQNQPTPSSRRPRAEGGPSLIRPASRAVRGRRRGHDCIVAHEDVDPSERCLLYAFQLSQATIFTQETWLQFVRVHNRFWLTLYHKPTPPLYLSSPGPTTTRSWT
jgi:hypothetical protein